PPRDRARSASAEDSGAHQGVDRQGRRPRDLAGSFPSRPCARPPCGSWCGAQRLRSEEHTSELQSLTNLVCRLLLEKKKVPHTHEALNYAPKSTIRRPAARVSQNRYAICSHITNDLPARHYRLRRHRWTSR